MSQSEEKCVELIALRQLNEPKDPEPHSSASSKLCSAGVLERCKAYLYSHWQCLETATLAVVVVIVLVLLLLPIILYHLPQPQVNNFFLFHSFFFLNIHNGLSHTAVSDRKLMALEASEFYIASNYLGFKCIQIIC